jgi:polyhydroxyalkanoate synthesis regulator phasin
VPADVSAAAGGAPLAGAPALTAILERLQALEACQAALAQRVGALEGRLGPVEAALDVALAGGGGAARGKAGGGKGASGSKAAAGPPADALVTAASVQALERRVAKTEAAVLALQTAQQGHAAATDHANTCVEDMWTTLAAAGLASAEQAQQLQAAVDKGATAHQEMGHVKEQVAALEQRMTSCAATVTQVGERLAATQRDVQHARPQELVVHAPAGVEAAEEQRDARKRRVAECRRINASGGRWRWVGATTLQELMPNGRWVVVEPAAPLPLLAPSDVAS